MRFRRGRFKRRFNKSRFSRRRRRFGGRRGSRPLRVGVRM